MSEAKKLALGAVITAIVATASGVLAYNYMKPISEVVPHEFEEWRGPLVRLPRPRGLEETRGGDESEGYVQFGEAPQFQRTDWVTGTPPSELLSTVEQTLKQKQLGLQRATDVLVHGHLGQHHRVPEANTHLMVWLCDESGRTFLTVVRGAPRAATSAVAEWSVRVTSGLRCH